MRNEEPEGGVSFFAKTQIEFKETGLKRERIPGGFFRDWKKYPGPDWEISWKGFESGA